MKWKRMVNYFRYPLLAAVAVFALVAAEHRGVVKFGAVPVPGVTVTATQGDKKLVAITGQDGAYTFPELADGVWNIQVEMLCFAPLKREIGISPGAPAAEWALQMLPMDQIKPETPAPLAPPTAAGARAGHNSGGNFHAYARIGHNYPGSGSHATAGGDSDRQRSAVQVREGQERHGPRRPASRLSANRCQCFGRRCPLWSRRGRVSQHRGSTERVRRIRSERQHQQRHRAARYRQRPQGTGLAI